MAAARQRSRIAAAAVSARPYGESQDPSSPHHADWADLDSQKRYRPSWFEEADVLANLESARILFY